jgi:hypothetical protein
MCFPDDYKKGTPIMYGGTGTIHKTRREMFHFDLVKTMCGLDIHKEMLGIDKGPKCKRCYAEEAQDD